jgi:hypothetical protein
MYFRMSIIALILLPLLLGGVILMQGRIGNTMTKTDHRGTIHAGIPPIDSDVPAVIETATFALG